MTTLGAPKAADDVGRERERSVPFIPHFWPEQGLSRYSLGAVIATTEGSLVRFGVVGGSAQFTRLLAIKQLNPTVARQAWRIARFKEELRLHARVRHPNVVELLDVVESGGESWLVLEHVDGATLGTLLADRRASRRPLDLDLAAGIVAPLLRGLHAVHEAKDDTGLLLNIVHGAVAPRHVMIDRDGQVKLLDFGMARAVGESPALGLRRSPGRFGHLSPELVIGDKVDRRSDIFAAGILLWEAIAGRSLFEEAGVSDADGLRRVLRAPIPELRSVRAETSRALSSVVHKALQRDPAQRFATAQEFALALESAVTPASPSRLGALVAGLGEEHFEPSRRALAAVRRQLPPPLRLATAWDDSDDEATGLALTGHFVHGDTLSPASRDRDVSPPSHPSLWRPVAVAFVAASLAVTLVVAFRRHTQRPVARGDFTAVGVVAAAPEAPTTASPALIAEPAVDLVAPIPIETLPLSTPSSESSVGAAVPSPRARRKAGRALAGRQPGASVARSTRAAECSPPTYLGDDGIRHFKAQCI
jgi:eukaryotic-like serine/threonine-protein kinase